MGALVGLGVGVGLMLVWSAFALPRQPRRQTREQGRLAHQLARAGLGDVPVAGFLCLCAGCGLLAALVVQVVSRTPPVAVAFGVMGAYLPVGVVAGRARRRQRDFAEVWPEAVDNLASAVRAGLSLPEALAALGSRGPAPLRDAFDQFALDYQVTGRFGECLDRLKARLADPVGDRVVEGLRIAREVAWLRLGSCADHVISAAAATPDSAINASPASSRRRRTSASRIDAGKWPTRGMTRSIAGMLMGLRD